MFAVIKKKERCLGTIDVILQNEKQQQMKLILDYQNTGMWDIDFLVAQKPQNKIFKGWKFIGYRHIDGDDYDSLAEMCEVVANSVWESEQKKKKIDSERLEKYKKFLDKYE